MYPFFKEEIFLFSRICRIAAVFAMLISLAALLLPQSTEAAKREAVHNLNYFQSYETTVNGRQALRIEIGMDRDNVTYDVTMRPYLQKQLVIDLSNTVPGKLKANYTPKSKISKGVHIHELEARHTQVLINCTNPVLDGSYAVHAEPADRQAKKPYRLVIDLFASGGVSSTFHRHRPRPRRQRYGRSWSDRRDGSFGHARRLERPARDSRKLWRARHDDA